MKTRHVKHIAERVCVADMSFLGAWEMVLSGMLDMKAVLFATDTAKPQPVRYG